MEMRSDSQTEADQDEKRGDRMNDEDARDSIPRRFRNRERILFTILLE
jgi:hypothetical protein